jgi:hydroxyethylthiazole kinase-like uncharacterized protein yjeF
MTSTDILINNPDLWLKRWPWPVPGSHKHQRGQFGVVTGGAASTGAARLSARAGLRIGAGLVTLFSPPSATFVNAAHETAIMVKPFADPEALESLASPCNCALIGPGAGIGDRTRDNTLTILRSADSAVLDADALTVFKDDPASLFEAIKRPAIMTPHQGEFKRVFPDLLAEHDRPLAAQQAAQRSGAVTILKGAQSIIASPDGRLVRNDHASPFLATAGSGDVLAGLAGGLMAQGMDAFEAACAACWTHGELALRFGPGLISEDLVDDLPAVLGRFYESKA